MFCIHFSKFLVNSWTSIIDTLHGPSSLKYYDHLFFWLFTTTIEAETIWYLELTFSLSWMYRGHGASAKSVSQKGHKTDNSDMESFPVWDYKDRHLGDSWIILQFIGIIYCIWCSHNATQLNSVWTWSSLLNLHFRGKSET